MNSASNASLRQMKLIYVAFESFINVVVVFVVVVGIKADYLTGNLGLWVGCPPVGSF